VPDELCEHLANVHDVKPHTTRGCEECLKIGDTWVHLRLCMQCGQVGCCDNSKNKHASKHARDVGHPVVRSFEPGERWLYCYPDEIYYDPS
jgi:CPA2 family monovalent cation:H+ antiporter-2